MPVYTLNRVTMLKDGTAVRAVDYKRGTEVLSSIDEATSALHSIMASDIADPNVVSSMLEILNDSGRVVKCERWVRTPIEEAKNDIKGGLN